VRPGGSGWIKEACERFMRTNGRWIAALILLGAGAFVAWHAVKSMP
jgi:predicted negative regulator of RcsB-dependent stress response